MAKVRRGIVIEKLFSCLKYKLVHHKHYKTEVKTQAYIFAYIVKRITIQYNLNQLSPVAYEHLLTVYGFEKSEKFIKKYHSAKCRKNGEQ